MATCFAGPSSLRLLSPTAPCGSQRHLSTSPRHFNHYKTLGVPLNATKAQIKTHFYQLSKKHHPDVSKDAQSAQVFSRVTEAYSVLSNDRERRQYDRSLLARTGPTHHHHHHQSPGYNPRPCSTATYAWAPPRRHSSPYTRTHPHRQPAGAHYDPGPAYTHAHAHPRPRAGAGRSYVSTNDKVLEELQRDLAIQRISGSWRAVQIISVLALAIGVVGGFR